MKLQYLDFIARSLYMFGVLSVPITRSTITAVDSHCYNIYYLGSWALWWSPFKNVLDRAVGHITVGEFWLILFLCRTMKCCHLQLEYMRVTVSPLLIFRMSSLNSVRSLRYIERASNCPQHSVIAQPQTAHEMSHATGWLVIYYSLYYSYVSGNEHNILKPIGYYAYHEVRR
jgi:hypothetical protein